ncbi:MAG: UDP-2,3-diacylglucosamine diphosphatase LpxI [Nitrospiraceae bacterium]|nr:MAG: UDP-2,3-diacylglucosamine diphosphatase LpxI [Nitrospiraceae bacterium]
MPVKTSGSSDNPDKLGLIAGMGGLPLTLAAEAKKMGHYVVAIALQPPADESLKPVSDEFHKINLGRFGGLLSLLKKLSITNVVMAGKVPKTLLYENKTTIIPDLKAVKLLFSLKNHSDDTIMSAVVRELEKKGITVHNTTDFTKDLLVTEGIMTRRKPTEKDLGDINFGWNIAKKIGGLDIGQTIVVKNLAVMAIEAIEGTDQAISRGGKLAEKGAVIIKVSKPQQDMRFDVPVVGIQTLRSMNNVSARVLALEAGKCIILDKEEFIREADTTGITVVGVKKSD